MTKEKARPGSGRPDKTNRRTTNRQQESEPAKRKRRRARKAAPADAAGAVSAGTRERPAGSANYHARKRAADKRASKILAALRRQAGDPSASWRDHPCYCGFREGAAPGAFVACRERNTPGLQCPHYLEWRPSRRAKRCDSD